ncbi:hypothetical protein Cgig2_015032 [Carnegiea gigantea]|uniref:Uncharacterized protein n=1 Tax=Carnegiea gigantea TaxID=171969 RepID=A0A9Q1JJ00_9CARY|nr:hypothetical protein Cgig2_015032 [Carnegiea gigantea]
MQAVQYGVISAQYSIEEETDALSKSVSQFNVILGGWSSVAKEVGQSRLENANGFSQESSDRRPQNALALSRTYHRSMPSSAAQKLSLVLWRAFERIHCFEGARKQGVGRGQDGLFLPSLIPAAVDGEALSKARSRDSLSYNLCPYLSIFLIV